jgi:hypothetical protein
MSLTPLSKKDGKRKMPTYKYRFCDGTVCDVEVSGEQYTLLKAMDKQERENNRSQGRRNVPLAPYVRMAVYDDDKDGENGDGG